MTKSLKNFHIARTNKPIRHIKRKFFVFETWTSITSFLLSGCTLDLLPHVHPHQYPPILDFVITFCGEHHPADHERQYLMRFLFELNPHCHIEELLPIPMKAHIVFCGSEGLPLMDFGVNL